MLNRPGWFRLRLALALVFTAGHHPPFNANHANSYHDRINIGLLGNRGLHHQVVEGGDRHLPPRIPIVPIPGKEDHGNILPGLQVGIFFVIALDRPVNEHRPPPIFPLRFGDLQLFGKIISLTKILIPSSALIGVLTGHRPSIW